MLKGQGVLRNNRKANVEKSELRKVENLIDSLRIVLMKFPGEEGKTKRVSAEVKLCQPELGPDECTEADLCSKCEPASACLKSPLSFPLLDAVISPVGHVLIVDSLLL